MTDFSRAIQEINYGDKVHYQQGAGGYAGTTYPIGTSSNPCNDAANTLAIGVARNIKKVSVSGAFILPSDANKLEFIRALNTSVSSFNINGQGIDLCVFRELLVTGQALLSEANPGKIPSFYGCEINSGTLFTGRFYDCLMVTSLSLEDSAYTSTFINCHSQAAFTLTVNRQTVNIIWSGGPLTIAAVNNAGSVVNIYGQNGAPITLAASCTLGIINLYGDINLTNNSAGSTVNDYSRHLAGVDSTKNLDPSDVQGNKTDSIPAMNLAPGATDSLVRHAKAILERIGATPADPDDSLLTVVGQRDSAATADDLSDVTTTDITAKIRRVLLRLSSDAFTATIQGAARTELDTMLAQLATYIAAAGAAYSATVDPGGAARTNIEQTLEDIGAVLAGAGITTYPAAAVPANGVSIAAAIRHIADKAVTIEAAIPAVVSAFFSTTTSVGGSVTLAAVSAIGGPVKHVVIDFLLPLEAAATFTPAWYKNSIGAPLTYVAQLYTDGNATPYAKTIVTPAAAQHYRYEFPGILEEGFTLDFRLAQAAGGAVTVEGALSYEV